MANTGKFRYFNQTIDKHFIQPAGSVEVWQLLIR